MGNWGRSRISTWLRTLHGHLKEDDQSFQAYQAALKVIAVRCAGATAGYASHVVLARLLGQTEFGIFALVWIWVLIIGHLSPLGFSHVVCRFAPHYFEREENESLRGFILSGGLLTALFGSVAAVLGAGVLWFGAPLFENTYLLPFAIALLVIPVFAVQDFIESLARAFNWPVLAIAPPYIFRNVMIGAGMLGAVMLGAPATAWVAACVLFFAVVACCLVHGVLVFKRVIALVPKGGRVYRIRQWFRTAVPLVFVDGTQLLFTNCDILILSLFYDPATIAVYFAVSRILQLAAFVPYATAAATAQRFSALNARDDKAAIQRLALNTTRFSVLLSLGVTLAILPLAPFLLGVFGSEFVTGVPVLAILLAGLIIQAAAGPGEDLLNMLGHERACAKTFLAALAFNVTLNFALIPVFGIIGAALATMLSIALRSLALAWLVHRLLNMRILFSLPFRVRRFLGLAQSQAL